MAESWIVNASPIIVLDKIGVLHLWERFGVALLVPMGVLQEIQAGPSPIPLGRLVGFRGVPVQAIDPIVAGWDLGKGESEVLTLALANRPAVTIVDDLAARRCAASLGIETHGTLFVLLKAKRDGLIPAVAPLVKKARAVGLFLSDAVVQKVLLAAGETE